MKRIATAESMPRSVVRICYDSGESIEVDFSHIIEQGGVFTPLRDEAFFAQVAVGEQGRYIEWPGGLDFCADALFERARTTV